MGFLRSKKMLCVSMFTALAVVGMKAQYADDVVEYAAPRGAVAMPSECRSYMYPLTYLSRATGCLSAIGMKEYMTAPLSYVDYGDRIVVSVWVFSKKTSSPVMIRLSHGGKMYDAVSTNKDWFGPCEEGYEVWRWSLSYPVKSLGAPLDDEALELTFENGKRELISLRWPAVSGVGDNFDSDRYATSLYDIDYSLPDHTVEEGNSVNRGGMESPGTVAGNWNGSSYIWGNDDIYWDAGDDIFSDYEITRTVDENGREIIIMNPKNKNSKGKKKSKTQGKDKTERTEPVDPMDF